MAVFDERKELKQDSKLDLLIKSNSISKSTKEVSSVYDSIAESNIKKWLIILNLSPICGFIILFYGFLLGPIMVGLYKKESLIIVKNCIDLINFLLSWILYSIIMIVVLFLFKWYFLFSGLILPFICLLLCLNSAYQIYIERNPFYLFKINFINFFI